MNTAQTLPQRAEVCCDAAKQAVGDVGIPASDSSDVEQELDDTICEIGLKCEAAMAAGDKAGAREYADRMKAAIESRTTEHQARLTAELEQRIDDGLCFFGSDSAVAMGRLPAHG